MDEKTYIIEFKNFIKGKLSKTNDITIEEDNDERIIKVIDPNNNEVIYSYQYDDFTFDTGLDFIKMMVYHGKEGEENTVEQISETYGIYTYQI